MLRHLYNYKLEQVGQAVCNAFIGHWFLFGIQSAASSGLGMHRTSTPCRRQSVTGPLSITRNVRFTVWQMTLPSAASAGFIPVINHLVGGKGMCHVKSSGQVELSLNTSLLVNVAENSSNESEDCMCQLSLSCDCDGCNSSTEQSAEMLFCGEPAVIVSTPSTSTCTVSCLVGGSLSPVHSCTSGSCDTWSSPSVSSEPCSLAQSDSHTVSVEHDLAAAALSLSAGAVHVARTNRTESCELFDVTNDSPESDANVERCYFTPESLFSSVIEVPVVSSVPKNRRSALHSLCCRCGASSDNTCYSCNNFTEFAVNAENNSVSHNYHDHSCVSRCRQLAINYKTELVRASNTCGWCLDSDNEDNSFIRSKENEDDFSIIAGISQLNIDAIMDRHTSDSS